MRTMAAASDDVDAQVHNAAALRDLLVRLIADALASKPRDVLDYVAAWADARGDTAAATTKTTHEQRKQHDTRHTTITTTASATATQDERRVVQAVEQLHIMAELHVEEATDVAHGSRDHYMQALEDSGYDLYQLRALEARMTATREQLHAARRDAQEMRDACATLVHANVDANEKLMQLQSMQEHYQATWHVHA